ncbi:GNAT family N-acetyltransferase [Vibrio palustris]|uniref:Putative ribosomal N-acetyltransferase YdaF n=1 Tax=Vibrio palustris TaxID=1918946 RepID=A0A1R4B532_9VIBR|nr:GNAT family protein [Vibrio palustris]SJL83991.1 Putative ribosomal N-acetyltransferase YdaF [Vibrio palustris]
MFTKTVDDEIQLALIQPSFARDIFAIVEQEREYLGKWLVFPHRATDEAFFKTFARQSLHDYADDKSLTCSIFYQKTLVGNISFNHIDHETGVGEVGYWLRESMQGKGIITRSVQALIQYGFDELNLQKIVISAAVNNTKSRSVCERLGMNLEGVITRSENLNGAILDHAIYGLLKTD